MCHFYIFGYTLTMKAGVEWEAVMKNSRILIGLMIAFALVAGLIAVGPGVERAQAKATDTTLTTSADDGSGLALQTQAVKKYKVWVGSKQVTSANAKNVLGNGTVSYNAKTNTLTLKNANIKTAKLWKVWAGGDNCYAGISNGTKKVLKIKLVGTNKITVPYKKNAARSYGITGSVRKAAGATDKGKLVICGNGKLTVKAKKASLYSYGIVTGTLTIQDKAQVVLQGATSAQTYDVRFGGYGLEAADKLLIKGNARLTAIGGTSAICRVVRETGEVLGVTPTYAKGYTPKVSYGANAKNVTTKKNPAASVYYTNKYVKIVKNPPNYKPGSVSGLSVSNDARPGNYVGFWVSWNALSKKCTGYELQWSLNSDFSGNIPTTRSTVFASNQDLVQVVALRANATHYFRVRAINSVNGKTYHGAWSAVKASVSKDGPTPY